MGDLINLRTIRKNRLRKEKSDRASENRALFGQTGTEKLARRLQADLNNANHENHRRIKPDDTKVIRQDGELNGNPDRDNDQ